MNTKNKNNPALIIICMMALGIIFLLFSYKTQKLVVISENKQENHFAVTSDGTAYNQNCDSLNLLYESLMVEYEHYWEMTNDSIDFLNEAFRKKTAPLASHIDIFYTFVLCNIVL